MSYSSFLFLHLSLWHPVCIHNHSLSLWIIRSSSGMTKHPWLEKSLTACVWIGGAISHFYFLGNSHLFKHQETMLLYVLHSLTAWLATHKKIKRNICINLHILKSVKIYVLHYLPRVTCLEDLRITGCLWNWYR